MKRSLILFVALLSLLLTLAPITAYAAGASVSNFSYTPKLVSPGSKITITFTINNNEPGGGLNVVRYGVAFFGTTMKESACNITPGASKTISPTVVMTANILDVWIPTSIWVEYSNGVVKSISNKTIKVDSKPDVIYSTKKAIVPDNPVYHIGETIQIVDNFANRTTNPATGVTIQYYKKGNNTIVYEESRPSLGTIAAAASKDFTYEYTFVAEDVGQIEIASIIRYTYQGVKYEEYCVAHYLTADSEVVTPAPENTPEPTPEPKVNMALDITTGSTSVNSGDRVDFVVDVVNTGNTTLDEVQVFCNDGAIKSFYDIAAGDSTRYTYTTNANSTTTYNFTATITAQSANKNILGDVITIDVADSQSSDDSSQNNDDQQSSSNDDENEEDTKAVVTSSIGSNTLMIAAIIMAGLIVMTIIVVAAVLIARGSKKD